MGRYIMALDQGTTSSRCVIFDKNGVVRGFAQRPLARVYPKPGWVEMDPMELWGTQAGAAAEAMATAGLTHTDIAAIGLANQRETVVLWDRDTGAPVMNAIVWQCRRTADYCLTLKETVAAAVIAEKTGLVTDAYFSATKIKWILENVPYARKLADNGRLLFGTVDSWLIWRLTKGKAHVTDQTNASRTMLYNIHTMEWDRDLLAMFGVPPQILPEVKPSAGLFGYADASVFGGEIPIYGVSGDQQAAMFGQLCVEEGSGKNTYGTGCFLLMNTGSKPVASSNGLITTLAAGVGAPQYALEGSIFTGGAVIQWLRDELGVITTAAESEDCARRVADTNGVYFVPAFAGLGAPYWNPYARGAVFGLTMGAGRDHLVRAAVESMAYQTMDVVKAMEADSGVTLKYLMADGGASANNFLMAFQADILGIPVIRPKQVETTALGAAYLAGLASGFWNGIEEVRGLIAGNDTFSPFTTQAERDALGLAWRKAVNAVIRLAE